MSLSQHRGRRMAEYQPFIDQEQQEDDDLVEEYGTKNRRRRFQLILAVLATLLVATGLIIAIVYVAQEKGSSAPFEDVGAVFKNAAVAADSILCSKVGKDILLQGGNAVDATISTLLCSGLTSTQSMGIGGGFFMTIYNRTTGLSTVIDARETAPGNATEDMFGGDRSAAMTGPLSIAIPGEIKGFWHAHQKYGQLPWRSLFQPAIKMAAEGFSVPNSLYQALLSAEKLITTEESLKKVFVNPKTGEIYKEGENMTRPQLANTLRVISEEGADAFYNGSLTDSIIADLNHIGSIITREDLLNYTVLEKTPLEVVLTGGIKIVSPPPPSSGAILSFILNILNGYNFTTDDITTDERSILTYHRIIEAFKFAYAERTNLADEDFVDTVKELVHNLTSQDYADHVRSRITDNSTHGYEYYGPTFYGRLTTGTSHLSVVDQHGNAVSVTSTINGRFGCERRGLITGIIFNNEMDDFSSPNITNEYGIKPSPANFIQPGKRPLSSMCPAVLINSNGTVNMIIGAAGGSRITTATAWVAAHVLWLGQSIEKAVDLPRLHHQLLPPQLSYETDFKNTLVEGLQKLGHNVTKVGIGKSIVQGIAIHEGFIHAVSDYRKGGKPDGF